MITIWIHRNEIDNFMSVMDRIDFHEEIEVKYYTYQPQDFQDYLQLLITYEEFVQLEDRKIKGK